MAQAAVTRLNPAPTPISTDARAPNMMSPAVMTPPPPAIANQQQGRDAARKLGSTLAGFMKQERGRASPLSR